MEDQEATQQWRVVEGKKVEHPPQPGWLNWVVVLVIGFMLVAFFIGCSGDGKETPPPVQEAPTVEEPQANTPKETLLSIVEDEKWDIDQAQSIIRSGAFYPNSVRFYDLGAYWAAENKKTRTVCGKVMMQNRYGVFMNPQPFIYIVFPARVISPVLAETEGVQITKAQNERYCTRWRVPS